MVIGRGKHTNEAIKIKELEKIIKRKDKEIDDIKNECIEQFKKIRDLCFVNDCSGKFDKLRKIHEIASDNYSTLVNDLVISHSSEISRIAKIIELSIPHQNDK